MSDCALCRQLNLLSPAVRKFGQGDASLVSSVVPVKVMTLLVRTCSEDFCIQDTCTMILISTLYCTVLYCAVLYRRPAQWSSLVAALSGLNIAPMQYAWRPGLCSVYSHHNLRVALSPDTGDTDTVCRPRGGGEDASLMGCDLISYTIQYCPRIILSCVAASVSTHVHLLPTMLGPFYTQ